MILKLNVNDFSHAALLGQTRLYNKKMYIEKVSKNELHVYTPVGDSLSSFCFASLAVKEVEETVLPPGFQKKK